MSQISVSSDKDFLILESPHQLIAVVASELKANSFHYDFNLSSGINLLYAFLDTLEFSTVLRVSHKKVEVFFLISSQSYETLVNSLTELHLRLSTFNKKDSSISLSLYNHLSIAKSIKDLLKAQVKKTSNPKIIKINENYWIIGSMDLNDWQNGSSVSKYLKDLVSLQGMQLSIYYKVTTKRSMSFQPQMSILLSFSAENFTSAKEALEHIVEVSSHYKNMFSCKILFHNYKDFKNSKLSFLLGLSKIRLYNYRIDEIVDSSILVQDQIIPQTIGHKISLTAELSPISQVPMTFKQVNEPFIIEKKQLANCATPIQKANDILSSSSLADLTKKNISSKKKYKPLIPYGKEVSEEEIERLLKTIPSPPS